MRLFVEPEHLKFWTFRILKRETLCMFWLNAYIHVCLAHRAMFSKWDRMWSCVEHRRKGCTQRTSSWDTGHGSSPVFVQVRLSSYYILSLGMKTIFHIFVTRFIYVTKSRKNFVSPAPKSAKFGGFRGLWVRVEKVSIFTSRSTSISESVSYKLFCIKNVKGLQLQKDKIKKITISV